MIEWLVFLAGALLFIVNLSSREHATVSPPSGEADATVILPQDLKDQLENYKKLFAASAMNPTDEAAKQATAAAKTQIDTELVQKQEDIVDMQARLENSLRSDTGMGKDIQTLHEKIVSYGTELPTLQDNLTTAQVITADKIEDKAMMITKAVTITVLGIFCVFVQGVF
jgi:hypothetical protein